MKNANNKENVKLKQDFEYFFNEENGGRIGFAGTVLLYDSEIYINTESGEGYKEVINKLEPLILKLACRYHINGNLFEDTKHDIIVHILEGIPKYNPEKNTKLSTFIEMRVNRRLINDIRDKNRISKNATYLNIGIFNISCKCGYSFIDKFGNGYETKCPKCNTIIGDGNKKTPMVMSEVNESSLMPGTRDNTLEFKDFTMNNNITNIDDNIIFICDINKWLKNKDPRLIRIIELIYFNDYSIKAAAEEVGLSSAGANIKLKELSKNKQVRELFDR
jgi:RNA polymerase sigma factor (sigma-70 family)